MFQARIRGWKRLAAGLVLVPGLTGLGADALGLLSQAAGQDRPASSRSDEYRRLMKEAAKAYDENDTERAMQLSRQAKALQSAPPEVTATYADEPPAAPAVRRPVVAAPAAPVTTDARSLVAMAKAALIKGDLAQAQDLATQAQANSGSVRWGLFEDTPGSVLKDVQKAKSRRDQGQADKLLAEARGLVDKRTGNKAERAANLALAEEKAKQSANIHGEYSMWDFGDRPHEILADIQRARRLEQISATGRTMPTASRPAPVERTTAAEPMPERMPVVKRPAAPKETVSRGEMLARKSVAMRLMQEGRALAIEGNYAEAKKKYAEAAKQNASFSGDDETPEGALAKVTAAAQRKVTTLCDDAKACLSKKDEAGAGKKLDDAMKLATSMGLDTAGVEDVMAEMNRKPGPAPIVRAGKRTEEIVDIELPKPTPPAEAPKPVKPAVEPVARPIDDVPPLPVIKSGKRPVDTNEPPVEPALPVIKNGKPSDAAALPPLPGLESDPAPKPAKPVAEKAPPLPAAPNLDELISPPAEAPKAVKPMPRPEIDKAAELLKAARLELQKRDLENARKLTFEVMNGNYSEKAQEEAQAILKSIDATENEEKIASNRRAFANGQEAYQAHNYARALAIFNQINGELLSQKDRKQLSEMISTAKAKQQEQADVKAAAPKPPAGVPDLPLPGPAPKTGPDNLLKQQEALAQVEFQKLRSRGLKIESEATARFGKGETDQALQDLQNYVSDVQATNLDTSKKSLLVRPIEARMDRLRILKHQIDFQTKEASDRRNFKAELTQDALFKQKKQEEVAKLMKNANRLLQDGKHKEAYVELQRAHQLDPDDPSVNASMSMAKTMVRKDAFSKAKSEQEDFAFWEINEGFSPGRANGRNPIVFTDDPERMKQILNRKSGNSTIRTLRSEKDKEIERKLMSNVDLKFKNSTLEGVVNHLRTVTNINFDIDERALEKAQIDMKQPITVDWSGLSLKSALLALCAKMKLAYVIENEMIRITSPKGATGRLKTVTLSVSDLVIPPANFGRDSRLTPAGEMAEMWKSPHELMNGGGGGSTLRTGGGLPDATNVGSSSGLPGSPGKLSNHPRDGGVTSNVGHNGTLEKELIRLITATVRPDSWAAAGGEGAIEYFPIGQALTINQSPEVIEEVERLLESLRKLQDLEVSIEVKVVSLAETFFERIGVDFAMGIPTNARPAGGTPGGVTSVLSNRSFGGNVVGLGLPGVPTPDLDIPIRATSFPRATPPFGGFTNSFADGGLALGLAFLSDIQVQMFLEAAQGDTRTNVMQAPKLTALNGTSASMTVGDRQFFVTQVFPIQVGGQFVFLPRNVPFEVGVTSPVPPTVQTGPGGAINAFQQPQTPGLGLFIQPVVSADRRFVRLNIQQSFRSLVSGTQQVPFVTVITPQFENGGTGQPVPITNFLQQPRFSELETQTVVVVPDGGTVVMGGLKYMTEGRNEYGPPVLSKIPYLNRLFKNVAYGREGRSILMMVTPRVIINREEQERQTGVTEGNEFLMNQ